MPLNFDQDEISVTTRKWNRILVTGVSIDNKISTNRSVTIQYQKQYVVNGKLIARQDAEFKAVGADFTALATANCNGNWNLFRNIAHNAYQLLKARLNITGTIAVDQ